MNINPNQTVGASLLKWYRNTKDSTKSPLGNLVASAKVNPQDQINSRISSIIEKLRRGKKLSPTEMCLLREHNPVMYQKALTVEAEREAYEKRLKACKSKEEVERLQMTTTIALSSQLSPNPHDAEKNEVISMRISSCEEQYREFKKTPEYKAKPDKIENKTKKRGRI